MSALDKRNGSRAPLPARHRRVREPAAAWAVPLRSARRRSGCFGPDQAHLARGARTMHLLPRS